MPYDPERHHRQSVRWRDHNYAAGGTYFVTLVTVDRECIFGEVRDSAMIVNAIGLIVEQEWVKTGIVRPEVEIDLFGLMPNHLHGLITIRPPATVGAHGGVPSLGITGVEERNPRPMPNASDSRNSIPTRAPRSLSSLIAGFKQASTSAINNYRGIAGARVWQRGFFERVVRDDRAFEAFAQYIVDNPGRWEEDENNPIR